MPLYRRHKVVLAALLLYWPAMFVLTHIPQLPSWVVTAQMSDKSLHFLAYLALVFLWWFAISPYSRVNWRKAAVWWTLAVMVWYGAIDEWLQSYVGRIADVKDFYFDLAGALTGLILLSIFTFWPASLLVTACIILTVTMFSKISLAAVSPTINVVFHLFTYAFFSILWTGYIKRRFDLRPPQRQWLIVSCAMPLILLLFEGIGSVVSGKAFLLQDDIAVGIIGITIVIIISCVYTFVRKKALFPD